MTSPGMSLMGDPTQTAVPSLKVMRLQSPELRQPNAGSLESHSILGATLGLPDSFGVIHVGETFTAYLGALNVSNDLKVLGLKVAAQLQTPNHRHPLPSRLDDDNSAGGVEVDPGGGVDAIVSRVLEEQGQHILRVEVGYRTSDGSTKTLRKFYRFNVSKPLDIRELTVRSGDASCFVSLSVENVSSNSTPFTISSVDFQASPGLDAKLIGGTTPTTQHHHGENHNNTHKSATELFDGCGRLDPGACFRYMFHVKATSEDASLKGIACGDELGVAVFSWRKAMGEAGRIASSPVTCPAEKPPGLITATKNPSKFMMGTGNRYVVHGSGLSVDVAATSANRSATTLAKSKESSSRDVLPALDQVLPVTVEPVDPPTSMTLAQPEQVQFLVVNHSETPMTLQLQLRLNNMNGVVVCGPSFVNLGELPSSGGSTIVGVRLVALVSGLMRIQGCCIVDLTTGKEIPQPPLFNAFVEHAAPATQ
mmetsp:Transcript_5460/g.8318  ORF Transcript_5460/g.8318 Transcript_5460/m.8318 type:complete len:479 (+) Transcript_5460:139-1575(+)|eukprot:CAMPEP_0195284234 /NCGR_PEP_ID=MMETSP0707-20130614/2509_1 /TAXON_ID=33640 /ORGANISM="Asterionellopsis glacialis, Strain CCMP134" /LENGTH=478 /DNA_ID=CAMNT_0040343551 /DNA_START=45 /DNA_END=1481 /DNA_ORIENTATION=+